MGFFSWFNSGYTQGSDLGSGGSKYTNDELLGVYRDLSYSECQDIFRFWPLGKRIIEALPNFAMSSPRTFSFGGDAPEDLAKRFEEVCLDVALDKMIRRTAVYARIYGMASMFIASKDENISADAPLSYKHASKGFVFNPLDPLSMGGSVSVELDPLSPNFQQPIAIRVKGKSVHPKRMCVIYNDIPLYLKFNPSSFAFTGQSVFQNMTLLIRSLNRSLIALQRAATKGGSIVRTTKEVAHNSGISQAALIKNNEMIRNMENDGIAAISAGEQVTFFDISGVQGIEQIVNQINSLFMMALADTPSGILLDKNLSFGLNDGTEDMKAILMAAEHFREVMLRPLYNFADEYLLSLAFNEAWLTDYMEKYPHLYRGKHVEEVFELIRQEYEFSFGELYPLNAKEKEEVSSLKLDNLAKLKELGATQEDLETLLNQFGLYNIDFTLEEVPGDDNFNVDGSLSEDGEERGR